MDNNRNKRVLIVDDDKPVVRILEMKLTRSGFDVAKAHDGKQALFLILNEDFDLIIMDLMLPEIDGFNILKEMREKNINTRIIILTNLSQKEDKEKAALLGAGDFLVKSDVTTSQVVEYASQILDF